MPERAVPRQVNQKQKPSSSDIEALSQLYKAAGDPLRLDIIRALSRDSFGVQELANIFAMPQPGMSHHLKVLSGAGILATRREGNSIFYRRHLDAAVPRFSAVLEILFATVDTCPLADEYIERIEGIYQERAEQSRQFFQKHADEFQTHQAQLCELKHYQAEMEQSFCLFPQGQDSLVLEVGSGHGELLETLSKRFHQVVALDASDKMLSVAKSRTDLNVRFEHGTLEELPVNGKGFDGIVLNMVLHHMPSPASVFSDVNRHLKTGGMLLVADLCSHQQEWVKSNCGDLWLGFLAEDLNCWAHAAGFQARQSQFIGLKNGFQIQIRLFEKV